jgi:hypothetical protein
MQLSLPFDGKPKPRSDPWTRLPALPRAAAVDLLARLIAQAAAAKAQPEAHDD